MRRRIPPGELQRLREFCERLDTLRERGAEDGLESLVERTAVALEYDIATLCATAARPRWANVRKLMRLAREFETTEGPDLAGLPRLSRRAAPRSNDREAEAATRAEGHAGVRVMTVHSAKGLEFGVVAVADLGRHPQLGWTPASGWAGPRRPPMTGGRPGSGSSSGGWGGPASASTATPS